MSSACQSVHIQVTFGTGCWLPLLHPPLLWLNGFLEAPEDSLMNGFLGAPEDSLKRAREGGLPPTDETWFRGVKTLLQTDLVKFCSDARKVPTIICNTRK